MVLQRLVLAKVRHLHLLHAGNAIGQYINAFAVPSNITGNDYAWLCGLVTKAVLSRIKTGLKCLWCSEETLKRT